MKAFPDLNVDDDVDVEIHDDIGTKETHNKRVMIDGRRSFNIKDMRHLYTASVWLQLARTLRIVYPLRTESLVQLPSRLLWLHR